MSNYGSLGKSDASKARTLQALREAGVLAAESDAVGDCVLDQLDIQGELLAAANENVEDVGSIMGSTRATLTGWQHKIVKNKIYMYAAAVFLFLVNVALICIMYEHHGNIVFR